MIFKSNHVNSESSLWRSAISISVGISIVCVSIFLVVISYLWSLFSATGTGIVETIRMISRVGGHHMRTLEWTIVITVDKSSRWTLLYFAPLCLHISFCYSQDFIYNYTQAGRLGVGCRNRCKEIKLFCLFKGSSS